MARFDIFTLVGVPCLLSVIHKTTEKGKTFANVTSVARLGKTMECPPQINPCVKYAVTDGPNSVFERFPDWLKDKIRQCREWDDPEPEREPEMDEDGDTVPF